MRARTTTDLLDRKSCVKPPHRPLIPHRLDTSFSTAPHIVNIRHSLLFSFQGLRGREQRIPAESCQRLRREKKSLKKKDEKKGKREATPTCCNPRSPAERDGCVGLRISSEEMGPNFHTQQRRLVRETKGKINSPSVCEFH